MNTLHGFRKFTDSVVVTAAVVGAAAVAALAVASLGNAAPLGDGADSPADLGGMIVTADRLPDTQLIAELGSLVVSAQRGLDQVASLGQLTVTARRAPLTVAQVATRESGAGAGSPSWE